MPPANSRSPSTESLPSAVEPPADDPDRQFSRRSVLAAAGFSGIAGDTVYTVEFDYDRDEYRLLELALDTGQQRDEVLLEAEGGPELVVADGHIVAVSETTLQVLGG